jgi:choline kinase
MSAVERVIILAAGKSLQLDGISKILIRHPADGRTILDWAIEAFAGKRITVVVGFRAIQIMQAYPDLDYIHNPEWALTNNAMSLGLALTEEPAYVVSGDIFIERRLIERLDRDVPDLVLTSRREKRSLSAVHCVLDDAGRVIEPYQGPVRDMAHPESVGLFKVSSPEVLRQWRRRCIEHSNLFAGQLLPCSPPCVQSVPLEDELFFEVNTPTDYMELIRSRARS